MTGPTEHVVIGQGNGDIWPRVVADHPHQRTKLVDLLLYDPGYEGVHARVHASVNFYVRSRTDDTSDAAERWLTVGFYAKFGAALFVDETTPDGADWCWAVLRPNPIEDPPPIYYDQPAGTLFPPRCVMPLSELRDVILEWVRTGQRPTSVEWLPINGLVWELTEEGQVLR
jgi:Immunity protein Imm1